MIVCPSVVSIGNDVRRIDGARGVAKRTYLEDAHSAFRVVAVSLDSATDFLRNGQSPLSEPFVGQARTELVEELLTMFRQIQAGSGSHLVVLAAPPGWGKTAIVHEFYRRLAADQHEPRYWPLSIMGDVERPAEGIEHLLECRKVVFPRNWTMAPGATMPWMWWGISCQARSDGGFVDAIGEDSAQLFDHGPGLVSALDAGSATFDAAGTIVGVLGELGRSVPGVGTAFTLAGAAKFVWGHRDLLERVQQWRATRDAAQRGRQFTLGESRKGEEAAAELNQRLARLTQAMPTVIVVDDAHFADEALCATLNALLRSNESRVLVVATGWPSHFDDPEANLPFARWQREFARQFSSLTPRRYTRHDLSELSADDVEALVRAEVPGAAPFVELLLHRYGANPLAIRALLRLPKVLELIEDGDLTDADLEDLPDVEEVFAAHWRLVPDSVRRALSLAAHAPDLRYLPRMIVAALEARGAAVEARRSVEQGVSPYAWARRLDDSLHSFVDPVFRDVARSRGSGLVTRGTLKALHDAIVAGALGLEGLDLSPAAREELLRQHVGLVVDGLAPGGASASASALALAWVHEARYEYSRAVELADLAIAWSPSRDGPPAQEARAVRIRFLTDAGRNAEALRDSEDLVASCKRMLGNDHPDTLAAEYHLANCLGFASRRDEAISTLEHILSVATRIFGPDHIDTLLARMDLGLWLTQVGQHDRAIEQLAQVVVDSTSRFGSDDPLTWEARSRFGRAIAKVGRTEEAIRTLDDVLSDQERVLGSKDLTTLATQTYLTDLLDPDRSIQMLEEIGRDTARVLGAGHRRTFSTRARLASKIQEAGRADDAKLLLDRLVADQEIGLGADDPDTLSTRFSRALLEAAAGEGDQAVRMFEDLLADHVRVLGADHPDTLVVRSALGDALSEIGRWEDAARMFEELLPDMTAAWPDRVETLELRANLAAAYAHLGQASRAIEVYEEVVPAQERILGADHVATFATMYELATALATMGRFDDAIELFEAVVVGRTKVLGPEDDATLLTRFELGSCYGLAGRFDDAINEFEALQSRFLIAVGQDHPDTLFVGAELARWLPDAGRWADGIRVSEALLPGLTRVLGADHRLTLATRSNLARSLGDSGSSEEAIARYATLVPDLVSGLGADDPDTLTARTNLALFLVQAGRVAESVHAWEELIPDLSRVRGGEAPETLNARRQLEYLLGLRGGNLD